MDTRTLGFELAERLYLSRQQAGLQQAELAKRCGISRQRMSSYENGKILAMKAKVFRKLVIELGVAPEYLLGLEVSKDADETVRVSDESKL